MRDCQIPNEDINESRARFPHSILTGGKVPPSILTGGRWCSAVYSSRSVMRLRTMPERSSLLTMSIVMVPEGDVKVHELDMKTDHELKLKT